MVNAVEVYKILDRVIPFSTQESWDNSGLLVNSGKESEKVLVCLDVTMAVVKAAVDNNIKIIVSHHPVIFSGITEIDYGSVVFSLIKNGISVISAHTNFDKYRFGTCFAMAEKLGLVAEYDENIEIGLKAAVEKTTVRQLAEKCKAVFGTAACTLPEKQVEKVFICAGSGSGMTEEILDSGAECFITGECKYHDMLDLSAMGVAVIAVAHDASEKISLEKLALILENENIKTEIYTADNLQTVI